MQNYRFIPISISLAVMTTLAACSSMQENSRLNEARNDLSAAQANPQVVNLAAAELKEASDSLAKANAAASKKADAETITHLAYLAKQRVAIAQETARQKEAEVAVTNASAERSNIRLQARTTEAEQAQKNAAASQRAADAAQQKAMASQQQAETSQQKLDAAELQAQALVQQEALARQQAELAEQKSREAEMRNSQLETQVKELKDLNAKKTDRGLVITLGDVLFDTSKADLKPAATRSLQKLADFLKKYPDRQAQIEGYTDSTGSPSTNKDLSDRRADAVRARLVALGVKPERITTQGFGPDSPVASNATPAGRQMNRRVEIILSEEPESDVSRR